MGAWIAGVDGCPAGWVRVRRCLATGALEVSLHADAASLLAGPPLPAVLGIDIPIGLPERGARRCDELARGRLGPRRSSVFPAPIRPALGARDRAEAARLTEAADGRKVSAQAFGLYPRIREVDALLCARPALRRRVREVHPEVSFQAWNAGRPMAAPKRTPEGHRERRRLVVAHFGRVALDAARARFPRSRVADDDLLDAFAVLWSAERIRRREAAGLPSRAPRDARGVPMQILY